MRFQKQRLAGSGLDKPVTTLDLFSHPPLSAFKMGAAGGSKYMALTTVRRCSLRSESTGGHRDKLGGPGTSRRCEQNSLILVTPTRQHFKGL